MEIPGLGLGDLTGNKGGSGGEGVGGFASGEEGADDGEGGRDEKPHCYEGEDGGEWESGGGGGGPEESVEGEEEEKEERRKEEGGEEGVFEPGFAFKGLVDAGAEVAGEDSGDKMLALYREDIGRWSGSVNPPGEYE